MEDKKIKSSIKINTKKLDTKDSTFIEKKKSNFSKKKKKKKKITIGMV